MQPRSILRIGIVGTVVANIRCFTPALVRLLGAIGLSIVVGWLDYVQFPALAVFIGITLYAMLNTTEHD